MDSGKVISITGGTGHLGSNLISEMLNLGYKVKALVRQPKAPFDHENLQWVHGDLNDPLALDRLITGTAAMIHCASKISVGEQDHELVHEVNVTGTENLVQACLKMPVRFIYISSSTAVESPLADKVLSESSPFITDRSFYYAWTKATAEQCVLKHVRQGNLDGFIIRPTAIIGPGDPVPSRFGRTILDLAKGNLPFITESGYNFVDVRDLSRTIINSISLGKKGSIYLTGGEFMSLRELSKIANPSKRPLTIPIDLLLLLLPLINLYSRVFPLQWPVNKESLTALKYAPRKVDSARAFKELHHSSRPPEQSIRDVLEWFRKNKMT